MEKEIYTVYFQEGDMTFIMEDTDTTISVKGFYFGEPNDELTKVYYGCLVATVDSSY